MKNILIYGASGHAKMIVDIIQKNNNYTIKGFIDSFKSINEVVYGHTIIGNLKLLPELIKELNRWHYHSFRRKQHSKKDLSQD